MSSQDALTFRKDVFPAQFFIQVEEGMARFDVPGLENLRTLLAYCEKEGYQVEWTGSVAPDSELATELATFPGGRYVAHLLPPVVLQPDWTPPHEAEPEAVDEGGPSPQDFDDFAAMAHSTQA